MKETARPVTEDSIAGSVEGKTDKIAASELHYEWSPEALEMVQDMDIRFRTEMIREAEICARCMGQPQVTPYSIREARCSRIDD